eukprot:CAMPEP_0197874258 /NCGR_PEP_ID=MMETSP1439-20131203/3836_1 /TAXON_ID=66791 /ORGANISM="Gonyaulax spinifera, Strain CCMP409" /LENGTH=150 /DNA_ID=CAMNT_0043493357 /DNA_START=40 /DNA_END=489 /DNA_ORIENTATION=-
MGNGRAFRNARLLATAQTSFATAWLSCRLSGSSLVPKRRHHMHSLTSNPGATSKSTWKSQSPQDCPAFAGTAAANSIGSSVGRASVLRSMSPGPQPTSTSSGKKGAGIPALPSMACDTGGTDGPWLPSAQAIGRGRRPRWAGRAAGRQLE